MHKEEAANSNLKLCVMHKLTYSRTAFSKLVSAPPWGGAD